MSDCIFNPVWENHSITASLTCNIVTISLEMPPYVPVNYSSLTLTSSDEDMLVENLIDHQKCVKCFNSYRWRYGSLSFVVEGQSAGNKRG